jgi:hypothetical protein
MIQLDVICNMLNTRTDTERHMLREARSRGMRNDSLVFVDVLPKDTHLRYAPICARTHLRYAPICAHNV